MKISFVAFMLFIIVSDSLAQDKGSTSAIIKRVSAKELKLIIDTTSVPMIVNFWATWCVPCIREIPWFDNIISEKNLKIKLLLVSVDFPTQYPDQLTAFVKKHGYKGEVVFLDKTNTHHYIPLIDSKWTG